MLKITQDDFINRSKIKHNNKYGYNKVNYINYRTKVTINCPIHGDFEQKPKSHLSGGYGCLKCGLSYRYNILKKQPKKKERINLKTFLKLCFDKHGEKYTYSNYTNYSSLVTVYCSEHGISLQRPSEHLKSVGCKKCRDENVRMSNNVFITKARNVHGDKYRYPKLNYSHYGCRIIVTCKEHGDFETVANEHIRENGSGCPNCKESLGEKKLRIYLKDNNIKFETEYKLLRGKSPRYDFYLPELNILIEYDGIQHYKAIEFFGGEKEFKKIKERDLYKKKLATMHDIQLIRMPYTHYNDLEVYFTWLLSKSFRYRAVGVFYKNFQELCKGLKLPGETKPKDVLKYLFINAQSSRDVLTEKTS